MNHYEEVSSPNLCCHPGPEFGADWHPALGERLAAFPRWIQAIAPGSETCLFWPDLATFTEDGRQRLLAYFAPESRWSLQVESNRPAQQLEACLFCDAECVARTSL